MTTSATVSDGPTKVWRYMPFSRFVWLLQKKQLWLSRSDLLGDPWEMSLAGDQLAHVIARHPINPLPATLPPPEGALQRSARIIKLWREQTFVSCWSSADHESQALWRIYCGFNEGVAIQSTLKRLRESVAGLPVYQVTYAVPGAKKQTPTRVDLVTKKRLMFEYEREVRVVQFLDSDPPNPEIHGCRLEWDPAIHVESIRVHPDADPSFLETVSSTVQHYAPSLTAQVEWSEMRTPPPF